MSNLDLVKEFHEAFNLDRPKSFQHPKESVKTLRITIMNEEFEEVKDAILHGTRQEIAHELADLLYTVYGTAVSYGIDIDKCFAEIHRANMSKLENGKPLIREDGKILKSKNYKAPDMTGLV